MHDLPLKCNAANNGRLVIVDFVQQWRSHAQKAQAQGCPRSEATDVAWPCYKSLPLILRVIAFDVSSSSDRSDSLIL